MIKFKHESDQECFLYISPKLGEVMIDMHQWFEKCGYEFVITSVIRKADSISKSSTHQTGRAFDCRAKHLDDNFIKDTVTFFNHKYRESAALSKSNNMQPTLIIPHGEGDNFHFHVQLSPKYENIYAQAFFKGE
jgi:hypothetical protein